MPKGPRTSPPGVHWSYVGPGHTKVWVHADSDHASTGGVDRCHVKACWVLAGELRRDPAKIQSPWRAFPAFGPHVFPERFAIHWEGMVWLQERWLAAGSPKPGEGGQPKRKRKKRKPTAEDVAGFLGQDPFG